MAQLTQQYPDAAARVFVDILNEPDSFQLQWQAQDDAGLPGAGDLYLAAMDAIYPVNSGEQQRKSCTQPRLMSQDEVCRNQHKYVCTWRHGPRSAGSTDHAGPLWCSKCCARAGVLFVIQGCGQQKLAKNWGDGLATDPAVIAAMGLSDPNPFFAALLQKPYLSQARLHASEELRARC